MTPKPACRIYGIVAREAPTIVLFRRGPSKYVQLVRWDISNDRFEPGQWFHGRIYERRCDLSPDGRLLVYFAANWKDRSGPETGSWTAVSKPPYLTALALWFKGDAWSGGGLFRSDGELGLNNGGPYEHRPAPDIPHPPLGVFNLDLGRGEDDPVETTRETRDGWIVVQEMDVTAPKVPQFPPPMPPQHEDGAPMPEDWVREMADWFEENSSSHAGFVTHSPKILEKVTGPWHLARSERLDGYSLRREYAVKTGALDLSGVDWAETDHRQRLVFSKAGKILAASMNRGKAPEVRELADLNGNTFAPMEAPDWARRW